MQNNRDDNTTAVIKSRKSYSGVIGSRSLSPGSREFTTVPVYIHIKRLNIAKI